MYIMSSKTIPYIHITEMMVARLSEGTAELTIWDVMGHCIPHVTDAAASSSADSLPSVDAAAIVQPPYTRQHR